MTCWHCGWEGWIELEPVVTVAALPGADVLAPPGATYSPPDRGPNPPDIAVVPTRPGEPDESTGR